MATVNPAVPVRRRLLRLVVRLTLLAAVVALAWNWSAIRGYAGIGAAYGARVACSCRYEGGRSLSDCRKDFEPGMEPILLSEGKDNKSVTARFPLLARETAIYTEGEGCRLEPWRK